MDNAEAGSAVHPHELPATVEIVPEGATMRILHPVFSAIYIAPVEVRHNPQGLLILADVAGPPSPLV